MNSPDRALLKTWRRWSASSRRRATPATWIGLKSRASGERLRKSRRPAASCKSAPRASRSKRRPFSPRQILEQRFVKRFRRLHLRRMAEIGKFDQLGVGNRSRRVLAEFGIIAKLCAHFGECEILADRRRVLVP